MKKLLLILMLTFSISSFSQSAGFTLLKKINGIEIYEKQTKTKTTDKDDYFLFEYEYINKTQSDLYYTGTLSYGNKGKKTENNTFCTFQFDDKKTFDMYSGFGIYITGDKTRLRLDSGEPIAVFKKNKTYSTKIELKSEKDTTPVLNFRQIGNSITDNISDFL